MNTFWALQTYKLLHGLSSVWYLRLWVKKHPSLFKVQSSVESGGWGRGEWCNGKYLLYATNCCTLLGFWKYTAQFYDCTNFRIRQNILIWHWNSNSVQTKTKPDSLHFSLEVNGGIWYCIAGNFCRCKISRKCIQTLQKKFSQFLFSQNKCIMLWPHPYS